MLLVHLTQSRSWLSDLTIEESLYQVAPMRRSALLPLARTNLVEATILKLSTMPSAVWGRARARLR